MAMMGHHNREVRYTSSGNRVPETIPTSRKKTIPTCRKDIRSNIQIPGEYRTRLPGTEYLNLCNYLRNSFLDYILLMYIQRISYTHIYCLLRL